MEKKDNFCHQLVLPIHDTNEKKLSNKSAIHSWNYFIISGSVRLLRTGATQGTPYRYRVENVTPEDAGFYSCVAGNILGETVSSAYLEVNRTPPIFDQTYRNMLILMSSLLVMKPLQLRV